MLTTQKKNNQQLNYKIPLGVDKDGVSFIGTLLKKGSPEFSSYEISKNKIKVNCFRIYVYYHKDDEVGRLE